MEKGQFFEWSWNYKGTRLNKYIKKEIFKKDLMNFIDKSPDQHDLWSLCLNQQLVQQRFEY